MQEKPLTPEDRYAVLALSSMCIVAPARLKQITDRFSTAKKNWAQSVKVLDNDGYVIPVNVAKEAVALADISSFRADQLLAVIAGAAVMETKKEPTPENQGDRQTIAKLFNALAADYISTRTGAETKKSPEELLSDVRRIVAGGRGQVAIQTTDRTARMVFI